MDFHISQVGFFKPILDGLQQAGVNVDRLLRLSGLDKFQLDDAEYYVPVQSMYSFFDSIHQYEAITDLVDEFSAQIHLLSLSQWGEMIAYTPDVLAALKMAVQYDSVVLSHESAGYDINGVTTTYWQRFSDNPTKGRDQADFLSFALAIKGFQLAAGKNWAPLEVHLQSNTAPNLDVLLPSGNNTKILLGQAVSAIVFPTNMLTMSMLGADAPSDMITNYPTSTTLISKLENLLSSLQENPTPNLMLITDMTELSSRSLQRKLAEEGTTISDVVDQWRFKKTIQLLDDSKLRIKDISEQLGYSNVPNFVRAFRRWTNTTPNSYRDLQ